MTVYAQNTSVPVSKSVAEIQESLTRYGADRFAHFAEDGKACILFEAKNRRIKFELPLPRKEEFKTKLKWNTERECSPEEQMKLWEQACRQKWRALALVIKAKLEAVESEITDFESEFLAHTVLPTGKTVGATITPQLSVIFSTGKMRPLLGSGE